MKMNILNTFNKARAAKLNPETVKLVRRLQEVSFNSSQEKVDQILEELSESPEMINEINTHDPSLLLAVGRLMPLNRDKLENLVRDSIKDSIEIKT